MVSIKLSDIKGSDFLNFAKEFQNAGFYTINFSATNLTSDVYYYTIT